MTRNPTASLQVTTPPVEVLDLDLPPPPRRQATKTPPTTARSRKSPAIETPPVVPAPAAPQIPASRLPAVLPEPSPPLENLPIPAGRMTEDIITQYGVADRYLAGTLTPKQVQEFERFCRENPRYITETGMHHRVGAAMDLLVATGHATPPPVPVHTARFRLHIGWLLLAVLLMGGALWGAVNWIFSQDEQLASWKRRWNDRPLSMTTSTREIRLLPSRDSSSTTPAIVIEGKAAQLIDFHIDETRSPYKVFKVTIDRINQGRVQVISNLQKDSDGHLRISLNSSALGPGNYLFSIEGITPKGDPESDSWVTVGIGADK
jgi:hypothetical protein